jgi:hypothetical protein
MFRQQPQPLEQQSSASSPEGRNQALRQQLQPLARLSPASSPEGRNQALRQFLFRHGIKPKQTRMVLRQRQQANPS